MSADRPTPNVPVIAVLAGFALLILLGVGWSIRCGRLAAPVERMSKPTAPGADRKSEGFAGSDSCRNCHHDQSNRWAQSSHAHALQAVDLSSEPPDGQFEHEPSGRSYRILRRDGELWHQEWLNSDGAPRLLAEHSMLWTIGSGHFSRSYLWRDDDFWMESPATWYASRKAWDLSPGYDAFNHGFERPVDIRCIRCHAGRVEQIESGLHRFHVLAASVDCERCHGPGAQHVAARQRDLAAEPAATGLVNPATLSRERQIDLCAQCHLHGDATVELTGGGSAAFHPGEALNQFQVHFALDFGNRDMSVVGHVEQMKLSRCFTESETLTCTTCHDPHGGGPAKKAADFRAACLTCHTEESCSLEPVERRRRQPDDDCTGCHMPRVSTDIPHFAFRHHRIGIHSEQEPPGAPPSSPTPGRLVPLDDLSHLSPAERDRAFGLAAVQLLMHPSARKHGAAYATTALQHLARALQAGADDPEVHAALARLLWQSNPDQSNLHARRVLAAAEASADARGTALFALARAAGSRNVVDAIPYWEQLVKIRRYGDAWHALGRGYFNQGRLQEAIAAAQKAIEISPERPDFRRTLAACLSAGGRNEEAAQARQWAEQLEQSQGK